MPVHRAHPAPEWFQLTHTSADSGLGGLGGWGVKETSDSMPPEVFDLLRRSVTTRLVEVDETSQFASDDELWARPRRLMSREVGGRVCLWHAATAGPDATGRPGNVFTHAAGMKAPSPLVRPIEYWRSPGWLSPFGVLDVNTARLGELLPGAAITRKSVVAFIRAEDRLFSLEWLVAAVAHVVDAQSTLVLATGSTDEAALWLGAICYFTSAVQARRIGWVTYQRAPELDSLADQDLRIVCIPRADLGVALETASPTRLVLDPTWAIVDPGSRVAWQHERQSFAVNRSWQDSVLDAFALSDEHLVQVLSRIDDITSELTAANIKGLPLHWALSTALLSDPDAVVSSREDLLFECLETLSEETLRLPAVYRLLEPHLADLSSEAGLMVHKGLGPILREQAEVKAVESFVAGGWRRGEPAPRPTLTPALIRSAAGSRVPELLQSAESQAAGSPEQVLAAARAVTFVAVHLRDPDSDPAVAQALAAIRDRIAQHRFEGKDLRFLHPALLSEPVIARERVGAAAVAPPPKPPQPAYDAPAVPVGEVTTGGAAAQEQWQRVGARSTPPEGRHQMRRSLPFDQVAALAQLYREASEDEVREDAIIDCLLVAVGLRAVPLRGASDLLRADRTRAEEMLSHASINPRLRQALAGWLVCYWALVEVESRPDEVPEQIFEWVDFDPVDALRVLTRFVLESSNEQVARILYRSLFADLHGTARSLLAAAIPGRGRLGRTACLDAWKSMPVQRQRAVLALASKDLARLNADFGRGAEANLREFKEQLEARPASPIRIRRRPEGTE